MSDLFNYIIDGFSVFGEFIGYVVALGQLPSVALYQFFLGNTVTWEVLNPFTQEMFVTTFYGFNELSNVLSEVPIVNFISEFLSGVLSTLGGSLYRFFQPNPVYDSRPIIFVLPVIVLRIVVFSFVFNLFKKIVSEVSH